MRVPWRRAPVQERAPEAGVVVFPIPSDLSQDPPADLLTIGAHSYNRPNVEWYLGDEGRVRIGRYCSVHSTVTIFAGGEHRFDRVTGYAIAEAYGLPEAFRGGQPWGRGDVVVEDDAYLGFRSTVMSGVRIGTGAVVGAHAVVTRDVPPYAVVVGNPARVVRYRFTEEQRAGLLRTRWWDWSDDEVRAAAPLLTSTDIDAFLARYDPGPS